MVVGLETKPLLFLTFLLYVFPILLLILGAIIGHNMAPLFQINPSLFSMVTGFIFFGFSVFIIRKKNKSLSKKNEYKPFLVRKKPPVIPEGCSLP